MVMIWACNGSPPTSDCLNVPVSALNDVLVQIGNDETLPLDHIFDY